MQSHTFFDQHCARNHTDGVYLSHLRKMMLYQTMGLGPINNFIDINTGAVLNISGVCKNGVISDKEFWNIRTHSGQYAKKLMKEEMDIKLGIGLKDIQMSTLERFIEAYQRHKSMDTFRVDILRSTFPPFNVRAIHFFRWNGQCRSSPQEIYTAMKRYPPNMKDMSLFWKLALGKKDGAVTNDLQLLYYDAREAKTGKYTALISKGICKESNITIIGEYHDRALFGNFLQHVFERIFLKEDTIILFEGPPEKIDPTTCNDYDKK